MAARTALPESAPEPSVRATAAQLFAELRSAHSTLLDAVADLERACAGPAPGQSAFTAIRWKLSGASLARRLLWAKILGFLVPLVGEDGLSAGSGADLRRLQDDDIALLKSSTAHVARWTTDNALADWKGYCQASRLMRAKMHAAIEAEQSLLYPMLTRLSGR